jgi:hypothetical protein
MFVDLFLSTKKIFHDLERGEIRDWIKFQIRAFFKKLSSSTRKTTISNNIYLSSCEESNRLYNTIDKR